MIMPVYLKNVPDNKLADVFYEVLEIVPCNIHILWRNYMCKLYCESASFNLCDLF